MFNEDEKVTNTRKRFIKVHGLDGIIELFCIMHNLYMDVMIDIYHSWIIL